MIEHDRSRHSVAWSTRNYSTGSYCYIVGIWRHPTVSSHIVGIWAADGVLATGTGGALLDALRGKAAGLTILVVVGN